MWTEQVPREERVVVQHTVRGQSTDRAQGLHRSVELLTCTCDSRRAQSGFRVCTYTELFWVMSVCILGVCR